MPIAQMIVRSEEACLDILTDTLSLVRDVLIVNFKLAHSLIYDILSLKD